LNSLKGLTFVNIYYLAEIRTILLSASTFLSGSALIVVLLYQIYFVIFAVIKPRVAKDYSKLEYSLFYFEHITKMQKTNLLKEYEDLSTSKILNEILSQVS